VIIEILAQIILQLAWYCSAALWPRLRRVRKLARNGWQPFEGSCVRQGAGTSQRERSNLCQPRFMSDYTALKVTALDAVNELLNHVGWGADDGSERCAIIGVCRSHITENIDKIATTREQAFALIDEVAQQMKTDWDEIHDVFERK
jgi:hypothetical protein